MADYHRRLDVLEDAAFNFLSQVPAYNYRENVEVYNYNYRCSVRLTTAQMEYQVSDPGIPQYAAHVPDASSAYSSYEDSTLSHGMRQQTAMPYGFHTGFNVAFNARNVSNRSEQRSYQNGAEQSSFASRYTNTATTEANISYGSAQIGTKKTPEVAIVTPYPSAYTGPNLPSSKSDINSARYTCQYASSHTIRSSESYNLTHGSTQSQSTMGFNVAQPATPNNTVRTEPWWVNLTPGSTQSQATMESDVAQHVAPNAVHPAQLKSENTASNTAVTTGSTGSTGSNHSNAQPQAQNTSPSYSKSSKNHSKPQGSTSDEKNHRQESKTYYHAKITISMETYSTSSTHEVKKEGKSESSVWDADLRKYCSIKPECQKAKLPKATGHDTSKHSAKKKGILKPEKKNKNIMKYECNVCHKMYKLQRMLTHLQSEHKIEGPNVKHHCTIHNHVVCAKCGATIVQHSFNKHIERAHPKAN